MLLGEKLKKARKNIGMSQNVVPLVELKSAVYRNITL